MSVQVPMHVNVLNGEFRRNRSDFSGRPTFLRARRPSKQAVASGAASEDVTTWQAADVSVCACVSLLALTGFDWADCCALADRVTHRRFTGLNNAQV